MVFSRIPISQKTLSYSNSLYLQNPLYLLEVLYIIKDFLQANSLTY